MTRNNRNDRALARSTPHYQMPSGCLADVAVATPAERYPSLTRPAGFFDPLEHYRPPYSPSGDVSYAQQFNPGEHYYMPAGALPGVPTSGTPAQNYGAGSTNFGTTIQVVGAEPSVNAGAFGATLQRTVNEIMGPGFTVSNAAIVKGSRGTQSVPWQRSARGTVALAVITALVPPLGVAVGNAPSGNVNVMSTWLSVEATITANGPWVLNGDNGLNQAIARAVAQVTSFGAPQPYYVGKVPTDGGSLDQQLRSRNACSGGANYNQVYARACTRTSDTSPVATVVTVPNQADPGTPLAQQNNGMGAPNPSSVPNVSPGQTCAVRLLAASHLRSSATFSLAGSVAYPAGTAVTVTGPYVARQGALTLYPVSIAGTAGFMPLSVAEMAPCTTFSAPPAPTSGGGGGSSPHLPAPRPTPGSPATIPGQSIQGALGGGSTSLFSSPWTWGALAFVAVLGGGAVYKYRHQIVAKVEKHTGPRHAAKSNRRHRSRRAR